MRKYNTAWRIVHVAESLSGGIKHTGSFSRSGGLWSAIAKNMRLMNLKAAKRITVTYDPFHQNARTAREVAFQLSTPKVVDTNPFCMTKTVIECTRSAPTIEIDLIPIVHETTGFKQIKLNASHLTTLEVLQAINKHVTPFAPAEEETVKRKKEKKNDNKKRKKLK